uniref:ACYPI000457 protein n=1 Tax=Acyrthosiphon pisum TaxID=7029 RepID=C4WWM9_ACYPI|nr:ACYPI000457 [Acyrthosiphon pisum]
MNTYRRRGLAKVIAEKALLSESLKNLNKATWYSVDKSQLDNDVYSSFVQMHADADTERFLDDSIEQSDRLLPQVWKSMVSSVLNVFMTKTSINGYGLVCPLDYGFVEHHSPFNIFNPASSTKMCHIHIIFRSFIVFKYYTQYKVPILLLCIHGYII